eukprot:6181880-Pleurochrysis_carterae.AAC.1
MGSSSCVSQPSYGGYVLCCAPLMAGVCPVGARVPQVEILVNSLSNVQSCVYPWGADGQAVASCVHSKFV